MTTPQEGLAARLERALQKGAPQLGVEHLISVERLTSGLSSQSYGISAETSDGPAKWVMRVEPKHGVIPPYDITREYRLLCAVGEAGLTVPQALHLEEDADAIGGRFMLMSFVEGVIYSNNDPRLLADPELTASIQAQFVETMAQIHTVQQTVLPTYADGREAARAEIAVCRDRLAKVELLPAPILRRALDILDRQAPQAQRLALLHGDFRLPNLMFHDGKLAGILDWELARVGDPLSDLAFTQTVGLGLCSIKDELAKRYGEISGVEIDERKIAYYKLLEMTKGAIIGLGGASDIAHGGSDLRLLSVANIALSGQSFLGVLEDQIDSFQEA